MNNLINKIEEKKITEILHFTTNVGLVGVASVNQLLARSKLGEHDTLEYIVKPNARFRSDPEWVDYVNLSLSRINTSFFQHSKGWHRKPNNYWVILSFKPEVLTHEGVFFTSTNNIYSAQCKRGQDVTGLNLAYAETVLSRKGAVKSRCDGMPLNWTTCEEAEILYPNCLSLDYLNCIYVEDEETSDLACAALGVTDREFTIMVEPRKFEGK